MNSSPEFGTFSNPKIWTGSEGNALSTLTVKVSENISELDNENFLVSKLADGNEITYTFASSNFNKLKEKEIDIRSSYNPSSIELNR